MNDTSIWIVTHVILVGILFLLPPCTICNNTQIFETVMATDYEPVQSIVSSRLPATKMKNDAVLYVMKALGMHSKLAIRYSTIQALYAAINYCFQTPFSTLLKFETNNIEKFKLK